MSSILEALLALCPIHNEADGHCLLSISFFGSFLVNNLHMVVAIIC